MNLVDPSPPPPARRRRVTRHPRPAPAVPLPVAALPVSLPPELDPDGDVTVEAFVRADEVVAGDRATVALDRWRAAIRGWCAETGTPVADVRRGGQWPDEPPPAG